MKVRIENPRPGQRVLEVEVPAERVEEEFGSVYNSYRKKLAVPGFRKGKTPFSVLQARFGPKIESEVLGKLLPLAYKEATQQEQLTPIESPRVSDVEFKRGAPFRFKAVVEVKPEPQLGDYRGLRVAKRLKAITDKDVAEALASLRWEKAILTPVERGAEGGDLLNIGLREEGGAEEELEVDLGEGKLLPQFESQLVGMAKGEEREIDVDYPATYPDARYQGRRVRFLVRVMEVKERKLPELDEEFLAEVGNFRSLEELQERIRADLQAQAEVAAQKELREGILDRLIEEASLEVPESMIKTYLDYLVSQAKKGNKAVNEEQVRDRYRPQAIREITFSLILEEIAKREGIETSPEEVEAKVKEMAKRYNMGEDEARDWLVKTDQMKGLVQRLREEKVFNFLISEGEITTVTI